MHDLLTLYGISNMVAEAARHAGFKVNIEHHGGLSDGRRPGKVIKYNWDGARHLLIDFSIVAPAGETHAR